MIRRLSILLSALTLLVALAYWYEEEDAVYPDIIQLSDEIITYEEESVVEALNQDEIIYQVEELEVVEEDSASSVEEPEDSQYEYGLDVDSLASAIMKYGGYAYTSLSSEEQVVYCEIFQAILARVESVNVSTVDEDRLAHIYYCVLNDHPEFFYVEGFSGKKYMMDNKIVRIEVIPDYILNETDSGIYQDNIDAYVADFMAQLPSGASEYDIAKNIYEYVVLHTDYNLNAPLNQTICSVTTYGESVCQGYAETVQYLCGEVGLFATIATGTVRSGENHAWNLVRVDGAYYYMDATWGDPEYGESTEYSSENTVNYDYLLLSEEQLTVTHIIDSLVPMPECNSTEANYYRKEGLYFTYYDKEGLQALFQGATLSGESVVAFQCSSSEVYNEIFNYLIEESEVFSMLSAEQTSIAYTGNESQRVITFWIN